LAALSRCLAIGELGVTDKVVGEEKDEHRDGEQIADVQGAEASVEAVMAMATTPSLKAMIRSTLASRSFAISSLDPSARSTASAKRPSRFCRMWLKNRFSASIPWAKQLFVDQS
jgi:hypothetical protein